MDDTVRNGDVGEQPTALECTVVYAHYAFGHGVFALLRCRALTKYLALVGEEDAVHDIEPGIVLCNDEAVKCLAVSKCSVTNAAYVPGKEYRPK